MELEIEGANVSATTIHPGGIKTNIARDARMDGSVTALGGGSSGADPAKEFEKAFITSPKKAALQILKAVEHNKRRALIGPDAKVLDGLSRMPAGVFQRIMIFGAKRR
jgi:butyryl-CoA dehydrogenase